MFFSVVNVIGVVFIKNHKSFKKSLTFYGIYGTIRTRNMSNNVINIFIGGCKHEINWYCKKG